MAQALGQVSVFSNSPVLFSLISPCAALNPTHVCPKGVLHPSHPLSPSAQLFLGCPSPAQSQGSTLAVRHPCPSLLKGSPPGFPAPSSLPAMAFHPLALLQVLQLWHGPTGVPAAAEGHGQGEPGLCRVPESS